MPEPRPRCPAHPHAHPVDARVPALDERHCMGERRGDPLIAHMHPARVDALAAVVEAARETFGYHSPACPALALRLRCTCGSDALRAAFSDLAALDGAAPGEAAPQCTSSDMWCDVSARTTADG